MMQILKEELGAARYTSTNRGRGGLGVRSWELGVGVRSWELGVRSRY